MDIMDIADIAVETDRQNMAEYGRIWQNMAEYGRIWQIAVDCCRLRQSHNQSLIAKLVKTGGYI